MHVSKNKKTIPGRGNSKCKDPKIGSVPGMLETSKEGVLSIAEKQTTPKSY